MIDRRVILLLLLFISTITMMTFQSTRGPFRPFHFLKAPFHELQKDLHSLWDHSIVPVREFLRLREENRQLRRKLKDLSMIAEKYPELERENARLKDLLRLKAEVPEYLTTARVIGGGARRWPRIIVIDKGKRDGIRKDMAVRNTDGLVGKITEVYESSSEVLLITDPSFSASIRLQDSRTEGVLSGSGNGYCRLKYIPAETSLKRGDRLITSGLDGIFPPGIPAGVITEIAGKDELFMDITVRPAVKENSLEEVMILKASGSSRKERTK
jgi:rod shape-determining protein MreC